MLKSEPYLIGTKFMLWSVHQDESEEVGGQIYAVESYCYVYERWQYRSDAPWITVAANMILVEMK